MPRSSPDRRQPYGLKQNRSVPPALPVAWGSLARSMRSVMQTSRCLAPSLQSPHAERPYLPSPAGACKCSSPSGLRKRPSLFTAGEPPRRSSPGPCASSFRASSSASNARPTLPPKPALHQQSRSCRPHDRGLQGDRWKCNIFVAHRAMQVGATVPAINLIALPDMT